MVKILNAALTGLLDAGMVRDCSSGDLGIIVLAHRLLAGQTAATALRMDGSIIVYRWYGNAYNRPILHGALGVLTAVSVYRKFYTCIVAACNILDRT